MNQSELRKGNYFNLINRTGVVHLPESTVFEVVGLPYDHIQFKRLDQKLYEMAGGPFKASYADTSPISITPEWLERAGFVSIKDKTSVYINGRLKYWLGNEGGIAYLKNEDSEESCFIPNHEVKHVHQLQNLYFTLTGKELKFKS